MARRPVLALVLSLALLLIPVAGAHAAIPLSGAVGKPLDTTTAGATTRFHFHVDFGGSEHIKDMVTVSPRGLGANVANPTCPESDWMADNCPADTQIGTTKVTLTALLMQSEVTGRIYFLPGPPSGGLPGLGIILDAPTGKVFQKGETSLDPATGRLQSTVRNFPQDSGPPLHAPIRIDSIDIVLAASFVKNPLTCVPAQTDFLVTSYEDPGTTSRATDSYTPTGCPPPPAPLCQGKPSTKRGTVGPNVLTGTPRRDVISGLAGNDVIRGLGANDIVCGGPGGDKIFGGAGNDALFGGPGPDKLFGGAGKDDLHGGLGADQEKQ